MVKPPLIFLNTKMSVSDTDLKLYYYGFKTILLRFVSNESSNSFLIVFGNDQSKFLITARLNVVTQKQKSKVKFVKKKKIKIVF